MRLEAREFLLSQAPGTCFGRSVTPYLSFVLRRSLNTKPDTATL